jgi:hypothetical protein
MGSETTGPSLGPVMLDIGGDVGAVIVFTPEELDGHEIEIRRGGEPWDGTHVAVRARPWLGEPMYAAVFGSLPSGPYELRRRGHDDGSVHSIDVRGGTVTETLLAMPAPSELVGQGGGERRVLPVGWSVLHGEN